MPNLGQNQRFFLSRVTLKFDGRPWKAIARIYATSSFVHQFIAIGQFKLELQSWNIRFRSKLTFFLSHVTLKLDWWPWKTITHLSYATLHRENVPSAKLPQMRMSSWGNDPNFSLTPIWLGYPQLGCYQYHQPIVLRTLWWRLWSIAIK